MQRARTLPSLKRLLRGVRRPKVVAPLIVLLVIVILLLTTSILTRIQPASPKPPLGINVIRNGGFETEGYWAYTTANQFGRSGRDSSLAFKGNYSAKMEILKPVPVASAQPSITQAIVGYKISDLVDDPTAFGFEMRVNNYATFFETDGIEQIWITISSREARDLTYVWADFPLDWNSSSHKFLHSRTVPENTWFQVEKNLRRDWTKVGFPSNDTLISLSFSVSEPGTTVQGTDIAWIDVVQLLAEEKLQALRSQPLTIRLEDAMSLTFPTTAQTRTFRVLFDFGPTTVLTSALRGHERKPFRVW